MTKALVIGAGLTGAVAARTLKDAGWTVLVREQSTVWGGNIRGDRLNGVEYEPHGAHIFHSNNQRAIDVMLHHTTLRPYLHEVKTEAFGKTLAWPPQIDELKELAEWSQIESELAELPDKPDETNFETYAISTMGRTLYYEFIYGYTCKQWGCDPTELASSFAPKRIDLRTDGYRGLFRDKVQGWPNGGWVTVVDSLLSTVPVELGVKANVLDGGFDTWDAVIVTAPLDEFLGLPKLAWRGVRLEHHYVPTDGYALAAPVVNQPSASVPYTRRIETKQMSGQIAPATVVSYEYPGADARHYPIDDVEGHNRRTANEYKSYLTDYVPNAIPAGRLANYVYIDTDQAIMQGLHAAEQALKGRQ